MKVDVRTVGALVSPGDALGVAVVRLDDGGVVAVEVVPRPAQERVGPAVHTAEQHGVHAEPRRERHRAVDLVPVLADLGDGGVAADHGHDALVLVVEGLGRARRAICAQDVLPGPLAGLLRDGAELGERRRVRLVARRDVRDVTDGVHAGVALDRQVGMDVDAAPRPVLGPAVCATAEPDSPPAQMTVRVGMTVPSSSSTRSACTLATVTPSLGTTPEPVQLAVGVRLGLVGERSRAPPDRGRPGAPSRRPDSRPCARSAASSSAIAPDTSTPVGPAPTTTTSSSPGRTSPASIVVLHHGAVVQPQPLGVGDRVQRERVLGGAGDAEEAGPGPGRHDDVRVAVSTRPSVEDERALGQLGRLDVLGDAPRRSAGRRRCVRSGRAMSSAGSCDVATW